MIFLQVFKTQTWFSTKKQKVNVFSPEKMLYKLYQSVKTYRDLLNTNLLFLQGKVDATYYHNTPILQETVPLLTSLIKINDYGFFSTQGQPGTCTTGKSAINNKQFIEEQRGYIEGYVPSQIAPALKSYLQKRKDIYFTMTLPDTTFTHNIPENKLFRHGGKLKFNVTRDNWLNKDGQISKRPWRLYTNTPVYGYIDNSGGEYPNVDAILSMCAMFHIMTRDYCSGSVEGVLLDFFKMLNSKIK